VTSDRRQKRKHQHRTGKEPRERSDPRARHPPCRPDGGYDSACRPVAVWSLWDGPALPVG